MHPGGHKIRQAAQLSFAPRGYKFRMHPGGHKIRQAAQLSFKKTDILTLSRLPESQAKFDGKLVNLLFPITAQGKTDSCQLRLGEQPEEIGLILFWINTFMQPISGCAIPADPGIMAGGKQICAKGCLRLIQKQAKFDGPITDHAGVGGFTGKIAGTKIVHHRAAKGIRQIQHGQRNL